MNKYNSAMEKIKVSPEMEERILKNLSNRKYMNEKNIENKKSSYVKWVKPIGTVAACCTLVLSSVLIYSSYVKNDYNVEQNGAPKIADNASKSKRQQIKQHKETKETDNSVVDKVQQNRQQTKETKVTNNLQNTKVQRNQTQTKQAGTIDNSETVKTQSGEYRPKENRMTNNAEKPKIQQSKKQPKENILVDNTEVAKIQKNPAQTKPTDNAGDVKIHQNQQDSQQNQIDDSNDNTELASGQQESQQNGAVSVTNPIVEVKSIDELKNIIPFEILIPNQLPTGYEIKNISIISGTLVQITYSNGNDQIVYRTENGTENDSGDYTNYDTSEVVKNGESEVTLKGNNSLVNIATWVQNDYSFSLAFSSGIEKEVVMSIINNIKKCDEIGK